MAKLTDHMLEIVKGWRHDLPQETAKVASSVTIVLYPGRVVSKDANNRWVTGCSGVKMAFFVQNYSNGSDATNDANDWGYSAIPDSDRLVTAIPVSAAIEVATTEYDDEQTYAINEPLIAVEADTNQTTGGRLTNQGAAAGKVIGRVSRVPVKRQPDRPKMLFLYPSHNPKADA